MKLRADIVTISHHHYDHNALEIVVGKPSVVDEAGYYLLQNDVVITGIPTFHDNHVGVRRGKNIVYVIEAEGVRLVHLGDLGHLPDEAQLEAIGKPDVLFVPVGGTFTLDAKRAAQCVELPIPAHDRAHALSNPLQRGPWHRARDRLFSAGRRVHGAA